MRAAMTAIPYPIAFGGATGDGAANQFNKDDIDFVDYHTTMERMRRASDAYDFKQDRHTGKLSSRKEKKIIRSGVRTHAGMPPLELKSNALTTRPSWLRAG